MRSNNSWLLLCFFLAACYSAGPKSHPCIYQGHLCRKDKIYNYPDGKKLHMETLIYRRNQLVHQKVYYQEWPNGDYKLIDKKGFVAFDNDRYLVNDPSAKIPDDFIVMYFDRNLETQYWVYMNGQKMPYRSGYEEGTQVDIHTGDKPGVYTWKDAQLVFLRDYDSIEKARYENAMKVLHSKDSLKTN